MKPADRVAHAFDRIGEADRPEAWVALRGRDEVLTEVASIDRSLPLAGMLFAVKDNIDVAGLPTSAGAPSYTYLPEVDAVSVARLRAAGAVVVGKTSLDQFATGLVGTRSPGGAVRNAWEPSRISGGSSSGSAVVVALGIVDFALGTDTAGSGRVPAALNGLVGVKPTRGLVPATGVVPACSGLDCVTVFARDLRLGRAVAELMEGADEEDPFSRIGQVAQVPPVQPRIAVPIPAQLENMADGWAEAFDVVVDGFRRTGAAIVEVDIAPLLEVANLLYDGAFVAARYAAVGEHLEGNRHLIGTDLDATVASIILSGRRFDATDWARDSLRLATLAAEARRRLKGFDALLTPTTVAHPLLAEVDADPVAVNAGMGRFTNFANLLDYASLAVPAGFVDGLPFGIMLTGPAFSDRALAVIAERHLHPEVEVFVVGAHMSGQPLNKELAQAGGQFVRVDSTAPSYRLYAFPTEPPKPGLVRCAVDGVSVHGEVWRMPAVSLGELVANLPAPMAIGNVELSGGLRITGFVAQGYATSGAQDISDHGGWRAYLRSRSATTASAR